VITTRNIFVLIFISGVSFYLSNNLLDGTLKNGTNLAGELKSPQDSLYVWNIGNEAPFKYRVLHRAIVFGTYSMLRADSDSNLLFFTIYRTYALIAHAGAVVMFYFFIGMTDLKDLRLFGALLFALLPPMLLAYNVPVHTREDTLAYCLLLAGVISVIKNKPLFVLLISLAGVLSRETLLILPVVYLFFQHKQQLSVRLGILAATAAVFAFLRFYIGLNKYDHTEGLRWNISHPDQVLGFLFISFGFLWFPFFLNLFIRKNNTIRSTDLDILHRSAPTALVLILTTTFLGGIFNEIRLLYLLSPWIIVLALFQYKNTMLAIHERVISKPFIFFIIFLALIVASLTAVLMKNYESFIPASRFGISYGKWIIVTCIQAFLTLLTAPLFILSIKRE
jgi:hypothetical protein